MSLEIRVPTPVFDAKAVLGGNLIGPGEVAKVTQLSYSAEGIRALEESLPPLERLRWCKGNGYVVIAGPPTPLSIFDMMQIDSSIFAWEGRTAGSSGFVGRDDRFVKESRVQSGWLAIRKGFTVHGNETWDEQVAHLSSVERVATAAEAVWSLMIYGKVYGFPISGSVRLRTSDKSSNNERVLVGWFDRRTIGITTAPDRFREFNVRMSSVLK